MNWDHELELHRERINPLPSDLEDACTCEYPDDVCPWCERQFAEARHES